jgi:hypothetical protein
VGAEADEGHILAAVHPDDADVHGVEPTHRREVVIAEIIKGVCFHQGPIFCTFFPRKVIFRGKFRGICCGNDFSKFFPRKF